MTRPSPHSGSFALLALLLAGCRAEAPPSPTSGAEPDEPSLFHEITAQSGIDFVHHSGFDGSFSMQETIGAGGALLDYDGDGDLDLYLADGGAPGAGRPNRLYRREGDGRYLDVTAASGAGQAGYGMGAAAGDVDADGDLDLYVTNFGADALLLNDGRGRFVATAAPPGSDRWSTSACWADFEGDGDLDLYVATYVEYRPPRSCTDRAGRREYCGPSIVPAQVDLLLRNDGAGVFAADPAAGPGARAGRGLGALCADLDEDGRPDVYVANDGEANVLWINRGDGTFEDRALAYGAALNLMGEAEASMGIAVGDVDRNGLPEIYVTNYALETNALYRNQGAGLFTDVRHLAGVADPSIPVLGFGTAVAVEVAHRQAAADPHHVEPGVGGPEAARRDLLQQLVGLRVGEPRTDRLDVVEHVAVGHRQIEIAVVVEVGEGGAEAEDRDRWIGHPGEVPHVGEQSGP
ncbi:MAG: VCBS repeat-containing protein, partial [Thermoanaerobaculia bacterium]|nr:VCBS repeat-containing protein [Thermoanaerobaculia bacterium]